MKTVNIIITEPENVQPKEANITLTPLAEAITESLIDITNCAAPDISCQNEAKETVIHLPYDTTDHVLSKTTAKGINNFCKQYGFHIRRKIGYDSITWEIYRPDLKRIKTGRGIVTLTF